MRASSSWTLTLRSSSLAGAVSGAMPACMKIDPLASSTIGLWRSHAPYLQRGAILDIAWRVGSEPRFASLPVHGRHGFALGHARGELRVLLPRGLAPLL